MRGRKSGDGSGVTWASDLRALAGADVGRLLLHHGLRPGPAGGVGAGWRWCRVNHHRHHQLHHHQCRYNHHHQQLRPTWSRSKTLNWRSTGTCKSKMKLMQWKRMKIRTRPIQITTNPQTNLVWIEGFHCVGSSASSFWPSSSAAKYPPAAAYLPGEVSLDTRYFNTVVDMGRHLG